MVLLRSCLNSSILLPRRRTEYGCSASAQTLVLPQGVQKPTFSFKFGAKVAQLLITGNAFGNNFLADFSSNFPESLFWSSGIWDCTCVITFSRHHVNPDPCTAATKRKSHDEQSFRRRFLQQLLAWYPVNTYFVLHLNILKSINVCREFRISLCAI